LVHIFSAIESCTAFRPWHDKQKGHTQLILLCHIRCNENPYSSR
jgi:hypothetical protein